MSENFVQDSYRCRLDWGIRGTHEAVERGDIVVIVDTLSFSTTAVTAVEHGAIIYPCGRHDNPVAIARKVGAEAAVNRVDVPDKGSFSLSPLTYLNIDSGTRVVLPSLNGATCSRYAQEIPFLFVGAIVNAKATAVAISQLLATSYLNVTIVACGERYATASEDGQLRIAIEDYLGAGAILSYLQYAKSPEAQVCEGAFMQIKQQLNQILWDCTSGCELRDRGYPQDIHHAAQLNCYDCVPVMRGQCLIKFDWQRLRNYRF